MEAPVISQIEHMSQKEVADGAAQLRRAREPAPEERRRSGRKALGVDGRADKMAQAARWSAPVDQGKWRERFGGAGTRNAESL